MSDSEAQGKAAASADVTPIRDGVVSEPKAGRTRLSHPLPTNRVALKKQLEVGRAFAIASGQEMRPVRAGEVAKLAHLHEATVQLVTPFFQDAGIIIKTASGFQPSEALVNFNRAFAWDPEGASQRLAPAIRGTWFAQLVIQQASLHPLDEREAIRLLGEAASADPHQHEQQVHMLIDYVEAAGLITRDGGVIRLVLGDQQPAQDAARPTAQTGDPTPTPTAPAQAPRVASTFVKDIEGGLQFSVQFRLTAGDLEGWDPARLSALFAGIAQVLAAKGGLETREGTK